MSAYRGIQDPPRWGSAFGRTGTGISAAWTCLSLRVMGVGAFRRDRGNRRDIASITRCFRSNGERRGVSEGADDLSWRREIFEQYATERRSVHVPGYKLEVADDITRHLPSGAEDEVLLWLARFTNSNADCRIAEELERLRRHGWAAEWKVQDFDEPPDLKARLEAHGLANHHVEALMVLEVAKTSRRAFPDLPEVQVKEASSDELDAIAALGEEVWECRMPWLAHTLREMTHPVRGTAKVFCARTAERVVGSGWIEFHGRSRFAQLCGGSLLASYRGRGLYARLFERRLEEARMRGVPFIAVDAAPMSRPILERRGFRFVCHTYPMRTRAYETTHVTRG
jgi:GNAT superfamily N-acetyltransferase